MTVERTIQWMFNEYPDLFRDRADALNHLFCVLGNGYEWKNGQLVPDSADHKGMSAYLDACMLRGKATQRKLSIEQQMAPRKPRAQRWYFAIAASLMKPEKIDYYEHYVPLFNLPTDIRKDWQAAVDETLDMIRADGFTDLPEPRIFDPKTSPQWLGRPEETEE